MRRTTATALALVVAVTAGAPIACGDDDVTTAESTTTAADESAATTTAPASETTAETNETTTAPNDETTVPPEGNDPMDYEGQQWDFGLLTDVVNPDGVVMVSFDRVQIYTDDGSLQSGKDLDSEPIIFGNTDVPYVNDNPEIRTFVLADDPQILRIADPIPCASDEYPAEPTWVSISVDELVGGAWRDRVMASLTFDQRGLVSRLRLSAAC